MQEEVDQLIRITQVLRVRAGTLAANISSKKSYAKSMITKAEAVRALALQAETKLQQIRTFFE